MAGVGLTDDLARNLLKRLAIAARVAEHGVSLSPRDALLLGDALLRRTLGDVSGEGTVSPTCGDGPSGSWSPNLLRYRRLSQAIGREE